MSAYGALLARPHAKALALACTLGWLAFASLGLSIVLLMQERTGSFAAAGAAVGAFSCGAGALAPLRGRVVDRRGPRALRLFAAAHCAGLLVFAGACVRGWPLAVLIAVAAGAGAVAPPLIASARALWPRVAGPSLTRTGHAANALLGDLGTVLGPTAAAGLAGSSPTAALVLVAAVAPLGALLAFRRRGTLAA